MMAQSPSNLPGDPPLDLLLAGGTFVLGGGSRAAALGIRGGRVAWTGAALIEIALTRVLGSN